VKRLWPKSLLGQLMLLVALALFVAQAVNFALLLRAGERLRFAEASGLVVARMAESADRSDFGEPSPRRHRGRRSIEISDDSAVSRDRLPRISRHEAALRSALDNAGLVVRSVEVGISDAPPRRFGRRHRQRDDTRAPRDWLRVSVERDDEQWLNAWMPVRRPSPAALGSIVAQTLILYLIVLGALYWFARRLSRPLRALTVASDDFDPKIPADPVAASGPRDLVRLIEAHNAMRLRIGAMLDEKDHMLGAIGHDLRTPLAALRIRAENVEDDAERDRMVETIEDMSRTLEDILSLARLGRASGSPARLDLSALVDSAIEDFRDVGAAVVFEDSARLVVEGRSNLLKRALRNLIDNAVRYGGGASVGVRSHAGQALVEIDDDGPGIAAESLEAVFEPFARLEASRNRAQGGSGLGLALARAIVRDQGGELRLENRAVGGLRATISLPLPAA